VDHPLRAIRAMTDVALAELSRKLDRLYADTGRRSIAPEYLLRALVMQILSSVRSERLLMVQIEPIWDVTKLRHRGHRKVGWIFTFTAAAYNLVRMRTLGLGVAT
jgi:hypothetical protein